MPSPFPGMDPYLEERQLWPSVHKLFLSALTFDLNEVLPDGFVAKQEERVYLATEDHGVLPDGVVYVEPLMRATGRMPAESAGPKMLAEDPPLVLEAHEEEVHEPYIEILTVRGKRRVVTAIELLSPKNKYAAGNGRQEYLKQQRETLRSDAHLMEIDLLRGGQHTVAIDRDRLSEREPIDYLICLHRARSPHERFEVWLRTVRQRLPRVRIPLDEGTPDLIFDLQVPFDRTYDGGRFAWQVNYKTEPTPRLRPDDRVWADNLMREAGLR